MIERALRKASRVRHWLRGRVRNRGAILTYHRVGAAADPFEISVSAENFRDHLAILRTQARPMTLADVHGAASAGCIPPGAVALTLDDGYRDLLTQALPALEQSQVPATAFIVSGQLGNARGFWWDELRRMFRIPILPEDLHLAVGGVDHRWRLTEGSRRGGPGLQRGQRQLTRAALFWEVYRVLSSAPRQRDSLMEEVRRWAGLDVPCPVEDRALSAEELAVVARHGLVEIGAHSANHLHLAGLTPDSQRDEVRTCRTVLEDVVGRRVSSFAYPHGSFDRHGMAAVAECGYERACTIIANRLTPICHPMLLPRIEVGDWTAAQFGERLSWLFADFRRGS